MPNDAPPDPRTSPRHNLTILAVRDVGRSRDFYATAFGWPQDVDVPVYAQFVLPEGRGVRRLQGAGARLLSGAAPRPWGDEAAYFADPDGHVLVVARVDAAHR